MRNKITKAVLKIGAFLGLLWAAPFLAFAQSGSGSPSFDRGMTSISSYFPNSSAAGLNTITGLITFVIQTLLFFAGGVAVLFIIIGGFWYITSAGNEEQAEKGKNALINAIIGVVIIILSYVIVTVIANLVGIGGQ